MTPHEPFYIPRRQRRAILLLTLGVLVLMGIGYYLRQRSPATLPEYARSQAEIEAFIESTTIRSSPTSDRAARRKQPSPQTKITRELVPQHVEIGE